MHIGVYTVLFNFSPQVVVQAYNALQDSLSDIDHMLLQHKLQQIEKVMVQQYNGGGWYFLSLRLVRDDPSLRTYELAKVYNLALCI